MQRYYETESGAYMHRAENGFIVEVVQIVEHEHDPSQFVDAGEPQVMGEIRAQQLPKIKAPEVKVFVFDTLGAALKKLEDYFREQE